MKIFEHELAGDSVQIFVPERRDELGGFDDFLARGDKVLGFDTETTGLDIYTTGYKVRTAQFGNRNEAWVLRCDMFADTVKRALLQPRAFTAHNFSGFDGLVVDRHLDVSLEELGPRVFDTRTLAHLLDPRSEQEGGIGLKLKSLSSVYVDPSAPDTEEGLSAIFSKLYADWKKTVSKEEIDAHVARNPKRPHVSYGFANVSIDDPTYLLYAGLDPILARRLFDELGPMVRELGLDHLSKFEHHFALLLAILQRRGIKVDVDYTHRLKDDLLTEATEQKKLAARYGVANVNSTKQISDALIAMGETLDERTPSGGVKVDKNVLLPLADLDLQWDRIEVREPNPLADAVLRGKRSEKWATAYAQAFLDLRDANDRLHPFIGGLQARTARMSISRPPLQQLPSADWRVRRALIADPGQTIIAADYKQVEMRVLAALSRDEAMIKAILDGLDIHDAVALGMFGEGFSKQQRKLAKNTGFGEVFGGGAVTLARQAGVTVEIAKDAKALFSKGFPGIKRYGRRLQERAQYGKKEVITPSGRHLPLDRDRLYSATNYVVQSTARDLLAQAIVDIFDAGLGDYLLLPVHDELVAQAPTAEAEEIVREIGKVMESDFYGVPIESDPEVYGPSWGHGYGAPS